MQACFNLWERVGEEEKEESRFDTLGQFWFLQGWPNKAINVDIFSGEKIVFCVSGRQVGGNESLKKKKVLGVLSWDTRH